MPSPSARRVTEQTADRFNEAIRRQTGKNVAFYSDNPERIDDRLAALDEEWDIERMLALNSSALSLAGLVLGLTRNRGWLLVPLAVQGFFLQHTIQGWCPPLRLFRRLGFRTQYEIEMERYALKAIRGDFENIEPGSEGNTRALEAAER